MRRVSRWAAMIREAFRATDRRRGPRSFIPARTSSDCIGYRLAILSPVRKPMSLAVVIPFFQRSEGLLLRALQSVVAQTGVDDVRIVVVDDASPVSAKSEVARLGPSRFAIDVIEQANGGPAAARNRGLASLDAGVRRVAFLDSDDAWTDDHLHHANQALDAGHDFYFADLYQPGQTVGGFARAGRIDVGAHPSIAGSDVLHAYVGDMFDQIISGNVIGTSTVVYDFERFRSKRFDEAFFSAGEDYLFWVACARAGARFCFSSKVEVQYGYGVNVYAGSGWGTEGYLARIQNEMRYRKRLLAFDLTAAQRKGVQGKIDTLRYEFADDVVHRVSHRKPVSTRLLRHQLRIDPKTLWMLPIHAGQIVADRIKGRGGEPLR